MLKYQLGQELNSSFLWPIDGAPYRTKKKVRDIPSKHI